MRACLTLIKIDDGSESLIGVL